MNQGCHHAQFQEAPAMSTVLTGNTGDCESSSSWHLLLSRTCTVRGVGGGEYFHRFLHQAVLRAEGFI